MSVETAYRPCVSCQNGDHTVCDQDNNCWCAICWQIVPERIPTPAKLAVDPKYGPYDGTKDQ